MKNLLFFCVLFYSLSLKSQTCYTIGNRLNGNGLSNTCGAPDCSVNAKTGHIDFSFGASCPGTIPTLELISITTGPLPNPFCFDPGNCISAGTVRYCFRGNNLPTAGFMTLRLTLGASIWSCTYDAQNLGSGVLLPVILSYFKSVLRGNTVLLQWKTEQELNNKRFEIEKSLNGDRWELIANIAGNGSTLSPSEYSFTDLHPAKGYNYYRLKQIDQDGHFVYSPVNRVDNRLNGIQFENLYPNPVQGQVNLVFLADRNTTLTARITDLSGKTILSTQTRIEKGQQQWKLPLSGVSPGVYHLQISDDKQDKLSEKIVVM